MDKDEAIRLLKGGPKGIKEWNERRDAGEEIPLLRDIDLSDANMHGVNFNNFAALPQVVLDGVNFYRANLWHADLRDAHFSRAKLIDTNLHSADLRWANLSHADFRGANLSWSTIGGADAGGADFRKAHLTNANFDHTDLIRADLRQADLRGANLRGTYLRQAKLHQASFGNTGIACDLSQAIGLNEIVHENSSWIDVNSLLGFKDDLPEVFLRGCGLREEEIAYFRSQVGQPIRFYSCFISYSSSDEAFATRLYNDFQAAGIRCWKWNHDARTGESLWSEIDQAIRIHDKLVLIASESSLNSQPVNREIERAIVQEDERKKLKNAGNFDGNPNVLFPVRLDDYILNGWEHERKVDVTKKVIADARGWDTDNATYENMRDKLIQDLKDPTGE